MRAALVFLDESGMLMAPRVRRSWSLRGHTPVMHQRGRCLQKVSAIAALCIPPTRECRARGIEPGGFPPRETWTQEQRDAADRLVEILLPHAYSEALEAMLTELEGELRDSAIADTDKEKLAAQRSIALIDAGKWKHRHTDMYIPASWVRQILERFASGEVSLLEDEVTEAKSKKRSSRQRRRVDRGR